MSRGFSLTTRSPGINVPSRIDSLKSPGEIPKNPPGDYQRKMKTMGRKRRTINFRDGNVTDDSAKTPNGPYIDPKSGEVKLGQEKPEPEISEIPNRLVVTLPLDDETSAKLRELLRDANPKSEELTFGDDESYAILDLLHGFNSNAASRIYKIPHEVTSEAFQFSMDHRKKITPAMNKVLNKWGPLIIKKWKDEIGLGIVMFSVLNSQVRAMHFLENKRRKNLPQTVTLRNNVTPISEPQTPQQKTEEKPETKSDDILENVGFNA